MPAADKISRKMGDSGLDLLGKNANEFCRRNESFASVFEMKFTTILLAMSSDGGAT